MSIDRGAGGATSATSGVTLASDIINIPAGNIASTNVQSAINELDTEKAAVSDLAASSGSSLVGFIESGTGAVATTVQAQLRKFIFLSNYDTSGHFDTARVALSTSEKMAIGGQLQFNSQIPGSAASVFRVPNANTDHADFGLQVFSNALGPTSDTTWSLGYNPGHETSSLPGLTWTWESDYDAGAGSGMELHLQAYSTAGVGFRPMSWRIENGSLFTDCAFDVDKISFYDRTGVNQALIWLPTTTTATLTLNTGSVLQHSVNNVAWFRQENAAGIATIGIAKVNASNEVELAPENQDVRITSGTLRIGSTVGSNQFTGNAIRAAAVAAFLASSTEPTYKWVETDGAANNKNWDMGVQGEQFYARVLNDADSTTGTWLTVDRTLNVIDAIAMNGTAWTTTGNLTALSATAIPAGGTAGSGVKVSSTSNFGMFFGSGAPTLSAAKGSLYLRSDGSGTTDRAYINTNGSTTWTALTTVA